MNDTNCRTTEVRARVLLEEFQLFYPGWRHGAQNEHWQWLSGIPSLEVKHVIAFFNAWRPLSEHQPQVLLLLASAFPDQEDQRRIIENNFREEAGMQAGHDPHHKLLDDLIRKLGGQPTVVHRSESIMSAFHPRGSPKTGQLGSLQNRPVEAVI